MVFADASMLELLPDMLLRTITGRGMARAWVASDNEAISVLWRELK